MKTSTNSAPLIRALGAATLASMALGAAAAPGATDAPKGSSHKATPKGSAVRPNILFILADDLGTMDLGCYGSTFYETPNLDALARDGVRFLDAYAACSVSSPTRASIMTGKYPPRVGITDWIPGRQVSAAKMKGFALVPPEFTLNMSLKEVTIAEALKAGGYATYFVGKWHLGVDTTYYPQYQGFDVNIAGGRYGSPPKGYFSPWGLPHLTDRPKGAYLEEALSDEVCGLLDRPRDGKPFFMYYAMYLVHAPIQAMPDKVSYFTEKAKRLGLSDAKCLTTDREWIRQMPVAGNWRERICQGNPVYAGMVSHMDDAVGKIVAKLKALGVYDNTIIIFTSDNGGLSMAEASATCNAPYRAGKGWAYEGGVREPMIVRWPGVTHPGTVDRSVVISPDFYPTLLDMVGLPLRPEQHRDGVSFAATLRDGDEHDRGAIFWHYPHYSNQGGRPYGAVRDGKYKLIEDYETMHAGLYDLVADSSETVDLSVTMPDKVRELTARLHAWRKDVGAVMPR